MRILVGVYLIINCENGKIYIGSSLNIQQRFHDHSYHLNNNKHKNKHLQSAWNFYGADAFHFCIVEECSINELLNIEQKWIDANLNNCYNASPTAGNTLGKLHLEETKLKISNAKKGKKLNITDEHREVLAERGRSALKRINELGLAFTPEAKAKRSSLAKGNQKRRDNLKWPHALGVRCFCIECITRKRNYQKERQKLMKEGKWNFRDGIQIKNEVNI